MTGPIRRHWRELTLVGALVAGVVIGMEVRHPDTSVDTTELPEREEVEATPTTRRGGDDHHITTGPSTPATASSAPGGSDRAAAPTTAGPTTTATPTTPPRSGRTISLGGAPAPVSTPAGVGSGAYLLTGRISGGRGRVQLTVDGQRVGEYEADAGTTEFTVPVHVDGPSSQVGVAVVEDGAAQVESLRLVPGTPEFTTRGTTILDGAGRPFVPRGVNRTGLNFNSDPRELDRADFEAMSSWGANVVRLKLAQNLWLEGFCDHDPAIRAAVDQAVHHITDLGMVALLDLEFTTAGDPCGEPGLSPMPDRYSVSFWRQVATRYRQNPLVAFGIFNEPHSIGPEIWRNGGEMTARDGLLGRRTWRAVGMQELYDTVRATGARNLLYVSGTDSSHNVAVALTHPLDGYGIVYGPHIYCDGCKHLPGAVRQSIEPVLGQYPMAVTEFGTVFAEPTFNRRVIDWAESHGLGWMAFMWTDRRQGPFGLLESWDTYEPSPGGQPVHDALQRASR